jgi:hypothetical protein
VVQVMLINAVKDVASALGDLIQATKAASGKSITDPSMNHLKESAKVGNKLCFSIFQLVLNHQTGFLTSSNSERTHFPVQSFCIKKSLGPLIPEFFNPEICMQPLFSLMESNG